MMNRFGLPALLLMHAALMPVSVAAEQPKCSTQCAVELVNGCCPAVPDSSPIPAGGCATSSDCMKDCGNGEGASCTKAGWLLHHPPPGQERDDQRGTILYDKGCRLGDGRGCSLGMRSERAGYAASRDFESAVIADHIACQYGQAAACSRLSELHWHDGKYPLYADRACQLGSRDDCVMLIRAYQTRPTRGFHWGNRQGFGVEVTVPDRTYEQKHRRACELAGYVPSCILLAHWDLQRQLPVPANELAEQQWKLVFDRLDPLCERGEATACYALASANDELLDRPIKPKLYDAGLGPRLYAKACELSEAEACRGLGMALIRGRGIAVNRIAAALALRKACDLLDGQGCVVLSQITTDPKQAAALIREACMKGMRGATGEIYANIGLSEYPQPYSCSNGIRPKYKSPAHAAPTTPAKNPSKR